MAKITAEIPVPNQKSALHVNRCNSLQPGCEYQACRKTGAKHMKSILSGLIALSIIGSATLAVAAEAEAKTCKAGKILNPDTGKCVTPRGS
jgi:hypothetical protein